nr:MAG TPA: hypothetical protein [Bacteriophage sp.]
MYQNTSSIDTVRYLLESSTSAKLSTNRIDLSLLDVRDCTVLSSDGGYFYIFLISLRLNDDLRISSEHYIVCSIVVQYFLSSREVELLIADSHISSRDLYSESASRESLDPLISVIVEIIDRIIQSFYDFFWNIERDLISNHEVKGEATLHICFIICETREEFSLDCEYIAVDCSDLHSFSLDALSLSIKAFDGCENRKLSPSLLPLSLIDLHGGRKHSERSIQLRGYIVFHSIVSVSAHID